jgi:hypothetical protein
VNAVALESSPMRVRKVSFVVTAILVVVGAVGLLGLGELLRRPEFVDHVVLDNRTRYDLDVAISDVDGDSLVDLATAFPHRRSRVDDVLDPGDTWVFVITRAGRHVARIERARDRLEASGWRVVIPVRVEERLEELGQTPLR